MDDVGSLGIDIRNFDKNASAAMQQVARLETTVQRANIALKELEKRFAATGGSSKILERAVINQRVVLESLNNRLKIAKEQTKVIGGEESGGALQGLSKLRTAYGLLRFAGVAALAAIIKSSLAWGAQLHDTSKALGDIPSRVSKVQSALAGGLSNEQSIAALRAIRDTATEARNGSADAADKLKLLGVSFDDIKKKSPTEILLKIADAYQQSGNKAEALRRLTNLFGEDIARLLIPSLEKGASGLQQLIDKQKGLDDHSSAMARNWEAAWTRIQNSAKNGVVNTLSWIDKLHKGLTGGITGESTVNPAPYGWVGGENMQRPMTRDEHMRKQRSEVERYLENLKNGTIPTNATISPHSAHDDMESERDTIQDAALAEHDRMETESEIAKKLIPDQVKQLQRLDAENVRLNELIKGRSGLERDRLQAQIDQNEEARRAVQLQVLNVAAEMKVKAVQAGITQGFENRMELLNAEIQASREREKNAHDLGETEKELNEIAQRGLLIQQKQNEEFERRRTIAQAESSLSVMQKQLSGQAMAASIEQTRAEYEERITHALHDHDTTLASILQQQEALAQQSQLAEFGMRTPAQRHAELMQEQGFDVAQGRGRGRMTELQSRKSRGVALSRSESRELDAYNASIEQRKNIGVEQSAADNAAKDADANKTAYYAAAKGLLEAIRDNTKEITGNAP